MRRKAKERLDVNINNLREFLANEFNRQSPTYFNTRPIIENKYSWIDKDGNPQSSNNPPVIEDIKERDGVAIQHIDRTEIDFNWANELEKPKTKEIKREIIGYKFKDETSYYAFRTIYHSLKKSIDRGFNIKNPNSETNRFKFDLANQDCNIWLEFAKKHNLLEELFNPVYKEEKKLPVIGGYSVYEDEDYFFIKMETEIGIIENRFISKDYIRKMHDSGIVSFKIEQGDVRLDVKRKTFETLINHIND